MVLEITSVPCPTVIWHEAAPHLRHWRAEVQQGIDTKPPTGLSGDWRQQTLGNLRNNLNHSKMPCLTWSTFYLFWLKKHLKSMWALNPTHVKIILSILYSVLQLGPLKGWNNICGWTSAFSDPWADAGSSVTDFLLQKRFPPISGGAIKFSHKLSKHRQEIGILFNIMTK